MSQTAGGRDVQIKKVAEGQGNLHGLVLADFKPHPCHSCRQLLALLQTERLNI